jgi:methanogenic corrinoid protein MtbC1
MLSWCSYCQQFTGEAPPYENLNLTHGICEACELRESDLSAADITHARALRDIQRRLYEAGRSNDLKAAELIIEDAEKAKIRSVDILLGIIAPILYQVGEDWARSIVTVTEAHRFTTFCEKIFELIAAKVGFVIPTDTTNAAEAEVLLVNAPGNSHTLAIRILALWMTSSGTRVGIVDVSTSLQALVSLVSRVKPRLLLVSMALAEQRTAVTIIAERIAGLPTLIRPKVIVGGHAVKLDLVSAIPGADLMADIRSLQADLEFDGRPS